MAHSMAHDLRVVQWQPMPDTLVISRLTFQTVCRMVFVMASTDLYPLVDRIVPGGLGPFLSAARAAGDSFETIARRLATDHEVSVSGDTVRRWSARASEAHAEAVAR